MQSAGALGLPRAAPFKPQGWTSRDVWNREYDTFQAIPSSTRRTPSKALVLFSEILNFENIDRVLDAGSGPGRNAIYLAAKGCVVDAIDFSQVALNQLKEEASKANLDERINGLYCELESGIPFPENTHQLALDSYVSCHFVESALRERYSSELARVVKPNGLLFSSQFSIDDEYYRSFDIKTYDGTSVVRDPHNGVTKALYTEAQAKTLFANHFSLVHFVRFEFEDIVLGKEYRRVILGLVLQNRP